jgi:hypothetical protein
MELTVLQHTLLGFFAPFSWHIVLDIENLCFICTVRIYPWPDVTKKCNVGIQSPITETMTMCARMSRNYYSTG